MGSLNIGYSITESGKSSPKWDLRIDTSGKDTLEYFEEGLKQSLIEISLDAKREEEKKGFDKKARVRVDNKFEKSIYDVKPYGKIQFFARFAAKEAILNIYKEIDIRSPKGATGIYRRSNYVIYNNRLVAKSYSELVAFINKREKRGFDDSDVIRFINVTPYARKLELKGIKRGVKGKSKGFKTTKQRKGKSSITGNIIGKPNGAYYLAFRIARAKYKAVSKFMKFSFLPGGSGGITVVPGMGFRTTFKRDGRPYLYPTIVLSLSEKGIVQ